MFASIVWPRKLANISPSYVFLMQIIDGNCIFSNSLAELRFKTKQLANIPPPSRGGLTLHDAAIPFVCDLFDDVLLHHIASISGQNELFKACSEM